MRKREWEDMGQEARHLVELNHSEVPTITASYVFPDPEGRTIRVVHVDSKAFPEEAVTPIKFAPDPQYHLYHPMFIAIVDEFGPKRLQPPNGWGSWSDATIIERRRRRKVS